MDKTISDLEEAKIPLEGDEWFALVQESETRKVPASAVRSEAPEIPPASEAEAGIAEIATQAEVDAGRDNSRIVTPQKLKSYVAGRLPNADEDRRGIAEIATQAEVDAGRDNSRIVTPSKLKSYLAGQLPNADEDRRGIAEIATQAEVDAGRDNTRIVTPGRLNANMSRRLAAKEDRLGNPDADDLVLSSTQSGRRSWREVGRVLFKDLGTWGNPAATKDFDHGPGWTMPAGALKGNQGLRLIANGEFTGRNEKILTVYIGDFVLLTKTASEPTDFMIEIYLYRFSTQILKGSAALHANGQAPIIQHVQTFGLDIDRQANHFKIASRTPEPLQSSVNTYTFVIEKLM